MANEVPIRQDPNQYSPRNIFGVFDARTFAVAVAIVAVVTPIVICTVTFNISSTVATILCILVIMPIAVFGLVKRHGMNTEKWLPLTMKEHNAPAETRWEPDGINYVGKPQAKLTRSQRRIEKKATKIAAKSRRKETETEGSALTDALETLKGTN